MRGRPPSDDKSLARFLGMSDSDFQQLKSQPNAGRLIDDYLQAQRRGDPNAYRFLGILMQDHPELAERLPTARCLVVRSIFAISRVRTRLEPV